MKNSFENSPKGNSPNKGFSDYFKKSGELKQSQKLQSELKQYSESPMAEHFLKKYPNIHGNNQVQLLNNFM